MARVSNIEQPLRNFYKRISAAPYFSPTSRSEPQKKIVFLAESVNEEAKSAIRTIYSEQILEEINNRDANEMLVRSAGISLLSSTNSNSQTTNNNADGSL